MYTICGVFNENSFSRWCMNYIHIIRGHWNTMNRLNALCEERVKTIIILHDSYERRGIRGSVNCETRVETRLGDEGTN